MAFGAGIGLELSQGHCRRGEAAWPGVRRVEIDSANAVAAVRAAVAAVAAVAAGGAGGAVDVVARA